VTLQLTAGRAVALRAWLNDGISDTTLLVPGGMTFSTLDLWLTPKRDGQYALWASADDACGNRGQTGLVRQVTVVRP